MGGLFNDLYRPGASTSIRSGARPKHGQISRPVFARPADWKPHDELPELSGIVALDTENKDPGLANGGGSSWAHKGIGHVCGYAIASSSGSFYLPIRHSEGNIDPERVRQWLRHQAAKPDVVFVYANCQYDLGWLDRDDIRPINPPYDVQGMAALLDEFKLSYSLDALGREYLGEGKSNAAFTQACAAGGLIDPKAHMDLVPGWIAEAYGTRDAALTRDLYHHLMPLIEAENLTGIHALERECYLVGFDMKKQGVKVNTAKAQRYAEIFERKRDEALQAVYDATGVRCSATDNVALARALLVENPALDLPKTSQGRDSIRKDQIEALKSPVADLINAARRYDKAAGTFFRGYLLESSVNGRIHADFNPLRRSGTDDGSEGMRGATSGRWSSTNPNLTNIPRRDKEIGPAARECFEPEDGEDWGKLDFSSQEPRIGIHIAERMGLRGAREMADQYRANPNFNIHREVALAMNIERDPAKTINLGIWYGAGGADVCHRLGLPTEWVKGRDGREFEVAGPEGKELLRRHFERFPFIKALQTELKAEAERTGRVRTLGGRHVRFKKYGDEYGRTHKACNSKIQGSAADQMKRAQVLMRRAGITPLVVVHDESDVSIPRGEEGSRRMAQIKEMMESAMPLSIPVVAEAKIGANWGAVRD